MTDKNLLKLWERVDIKKIFGEAEIKIREENDKLRQARMKSKGSWL
jgi:hypothetical protein